MLKVFTYFVALFLLLNTNLLYSQKGNPPDNDEKLAAHYYSNGEFVKAAEIYEKLFNKSFSPFHYNNYITCLIELKDFNKAEKVVKKLSKQFPESQKYKVELGFILWLDGQTEKADKEFQKAINELGTNPQSVIDLANAFLSRQKDELAIKTYLKGRKIHKDLFPFNSYLADIYEKNGNLESMINEYIEIVEADVNNLEEVQGTLQIKINEDISGKKGEMLKNILLEKSQKNPSAIIYAEMLFWYSIQQKNFELAFVQVKALDNRYKEEGQRVFYFAELAALNQEYDIAAKAYHFIMKKGEKHFLYLSCKIRLLDVKFVQITKTNKYTFQELLNLEQEFITAINEFGKNPSILPILRNFAHLQAFYIDKKKEAIELLQEALTFKNVRPQEIAETKLELADILLLSSEVWEATLLYSQVEKAFKNEPIGHLAKFKNAKLSFYIGEFQWAKAQLDILKAATSKLIANDAMELSLLISDNIDYDSSTVALEMYARADLLTFQKKDNLAITTLDSILRDFPGHPLNDEVLFKKATILQSNGQFNEAAKLFERVLTEFGFDILGDDALYRLAELNQFQLNQPEKAMEYYQELIIKYPGSLYTVEARKRFKNLKSSIIN